MYQNFHIVDISPEYISNSILILASFDVDEKTVTDASVNVVKKSDGMNLGIKFEIEDRTIKLLIEDDIVPNEDYIIRITTDVKSLLGENLNNAIRRKIVFLSAVQEVPEIISPVGYAISKSLLVKLKGLDKVKPEEDILYRYHIQISKDVAFISRDFEARMENNEQEFNVLPDGQYFIRARIEKSEDSEAVDYGKWSKCETFILRESEIKDEDLPDDGDEEDLNPEFIEETVIIWRPENGVTPEMFMFEFNNEIDPDSIDDIVIIRRDM